LGSVGKEKIEFKHMIKGILFDKDGTLLDFNGTWLEPYFQASSYIADCVGDPSLASELMRKGGYIAESGGWQTDSLLASGSNSQIYQFWAEEIGRELMVKELNQIREIFSHVASSYIPAIENMDRLLQTLKNKNIVLGVATMDDESNAQGMLEKLNLSHYFDFVCGADSGFGVKPNRGMVDAFCQRCGVSPTDIYMVGDSPKDLNMGTNAGVAKSIGVLTGAHGREELEQFSQWVVADISELVTML
jgi:phosphoglycolate phosphatase